jgi:hypothetical protein
MQIEHCGEQENKMCRWNDGEQEDNMYKWKDGCLCLEHSHYCAMMWVDENGAGL